MPPTTLEEAHWQGAEARVYISEWQGQRVIFKQRFTKTYRHPQLDEKINLKRTSGEAKSLERAIKAGVHAPKVLKVDQKNYLLIMEYIEGEMAKGVINSSVEESPVTSKRTGVAMRMGEAVGKLHMAGMIHGDLTTSNMIVRPDGTLFLIDFGLASASSKTEDRAVDLYVLERALTSTHPKLADELFSAFLKSYADNASSISNTVLARLAEVQKRGRKRDMAG